MRCVGILVKALVLCGLLSATAAAKEPVDGLNCCFIGHSFFVPVSRVFGKLATSNEVAGHVQREFFRGGKNGSPGELWKEEKTRAQVIEHLSSGKVELLGMTYFSPANSSLEDYGRWIDTALKHNPDTRIFIGFAWGKINSKGRGGQTPLVDGRRSLDEYVKTGLAYQKLAYHHVILELRKRYPQTTILGSHYGIASGVLWQHFEDGKLPGIDRLVRAKKTQQHSIYTDAMGHANAPLLTTCALVWLHDIYGMDPAVIKLGKQKDKVDYATLAELVIAHGKGRSEQP